MRSAIVAERPTEALHADRQPNTTGARINDEALCVAQVNSAFYPAWTRSNGALSVYPISLEARRKRRF